MHCIPMICCKSANIASRQRSCVPAGQSAWVRHHHECRHEPSRSGRVPQRHTRRIWHEVRACLRIYGRLLSMAEALPPDRRVLDRLKETQPDVADQVHVFSSFFYKKLSTKDKYVRSRFYRLLTRKLTSACHHGHTGKTGRKTPIWACGSGRASSIFSRRSTSCYRSTKSTFRIRPCPRPRI